MYVDVDTYVRRDLDLYAHARVRVASAGTRSLRYDMTLERFGFGRRTAAGDTPGASSGLSRTPLLESTQPVSSQPVSSQLTPS